jgi:hypothetical protein
MYIGRRSFFPRTSPTSPLPDDHPYRRRLGNTANVSPTYDGRPTDHRFAGISAALLAPNCLQAAILAGNAPNIRENLR